MESDEVFQYDQKHKEDLQRLKDFCLMDDDFLTKVFEDKECVQFLLQIILNQSDLIVKEVHSQHNLKNLQGRSARLDIFAINGKGYVYDVEIQRSDKGAVKKRSRYNSSLMDANITEPGEEYEKLLESFVIFITENDVFKAGLPLYHINRYVEETGNIFDDGSHIIYVNSQIKDETALGKLMHDLSCTKPDDMNYAILADRVRYFKEDKEGIMVMCRTMENMRNETARETARVTALETARQFAVRLLIRGKDTYEEIAEVTLLPIEEIKSIAAKKSNN